MCWIGSALCNGYQTWEYGEYVKITLRILFQHRFPGLHLQIFWAGQGGVWQYAFPSPYPDVPAMKVNSWISGAEDPGFISCFRTVPRGEQPSCTLRLRHLPTRPPGMAEALNVLNPLGTWMHAPQALTGAGFQEYSLPWNRYLAADCQHPCLRAERHCVHRGSEIRKWKLGRLAAFTRGEGLELGCRAAGLTSSRKPHERAEVVSYFSQGFHEAGCSIEVGQKFVQSQQNPQLKACGRLFPQLPLSI